MSHIICVYVCMRFCNAWTPSNSLDFTSFLDYAFQALYFIIFEDPVNNCLPYKWQGHFQITFKKSIVQLLLQVAHKNTFQDQPFLWTSQFTQKPALFWYMYTIIKGVLIITTQTITPRGSILHNDHSKPSQEGGHLVIN